jgi:hypothetical protein
VKRLPYIKRFRDDLVIGQVKTESGIQNQLQTRYNALVALIHMLRHQSAGHDIPGARG